MDEERAIAHEGGKEIVKDKHLLAERFWKRTLLKYNNLSLTEFVYLPNFDPTRK
jgi:hypothetical protein